METREVDDWLGKTYRDKITGYQGVATGYVRYITECDQVLLAGKVGADGTVTTLWTDIQRVEEVEAERIVLDNSKTPGFGETPPVR